MPLLTDHFSINELSTTMRPEYNVPGPIEELYLLRLAETVLEPLRTLWGCPILIHSAYRSQAVNAAVGGRPDSQHLTGRAVDLSPASMTVEAGFLMLVMSGIPYDQAIIESVGPNKWIHVSIPKIYNRPRREALTTEDGVRFAAYNPPATGAVT